MQAVMIRIARPADGDAMTTMQRISWLAVYGESLGSDKLAQLSVADHQRSWQWRLSNADPKPMLLSLGQEIIGLLYWQPEELDEQQIARIRSFYLHPDYWHQGYGKRLWLVVAMQMRRAHCSHAYLWLSDVNQIAERFCLRRGFIYSGECREHCYQGLIYTQREMVLQF